MDYPVWLWRPNGDMTESLEWMTDIIEAHDGSEQRIQIRQEPRQSFKASVLVSDPIQQSRIRSLLASWQHKVWGWPCWHEATPLISVANSGAFSVQVNTENADWREGGFALVLESFSKYQVLEISEISEGQLSFSSALLSTYGAGSWAFPLRLARLASQIDRQDYVGNDLEYDISVSVLDNTEIASDPSVVQYLGHDVLTEQLLLSGTSTKRQITRPLKVLDPGMGSWSVFSKNDFSSMSTEHQWLLKTPELCWNFRKWLHRRAGALRPVWVPSHVEDLKLAVIPNGSTTTLQIYDANYRTLGLNKVGTTHIAVFSASGGFVCRQITNAVTGSAGQENLTINTNLGFSDAYKVSFLSLCRFIGDKLTLKWNRVGSAVCSSTMIGVPS